MMVKEIKPQWWRLISEGDESQATLTFYGYSKAEVLGKLASWIRLQDVRRLSR